MRSRTTSAWGSLSAGSKEYYRDKGITAGTYNAWHRRPQIERTEISRIARGRGYQDGLQFFAARAQVKSYTGKDLSIVTRPAEAAKRLLEGRGKRDKSRDIVPKLFNFNKFSHVEWEEFLSG